MSGFGVRGQGSRVRGWGSRVRGSEGEERHALIRGALKWGCTD